MGRAIEESTLILGFDGGGTGTTCCLLDFSGTAPPSILARGQAGPANPGHCDLDNVAANLKQSLTTCINQAGVSLGNVAGCGIALAGTGQKVLRRQVEIRCREMFPGLPIKVTHDAEPVLMEGTPNGIGICLIAGTGSFAFSRRADGQTMRAGGRGFPLGDQGSGSWIGRKALTRVVRQLDGYEANMEFSDTLLGELEIEGQELLESLSERYREPRDLAAVAPAVLQIAERGNPIAVGLVERAIGHLSDLVTRLSHGDYWPMGPVAIAIGGGLPCGSEYFRRLLFEHLSKRVGATARMQLVTDPARGAGLIAKQFLDDRMNQRSSRE